MGWKGFMRDVVAMHNRRVRLEQQDQRRREQAVAAGHRREREQMKHRAHVLKEMQRLEKLRDDAAEKARARNDVELYDSYLENLVSLHKDASQPWAWETIARIAPPPEPVYVTAAESPAQYALATYAPSVTDRMLSRENLVISQLQAAIVTARQQDHAQFQQAMERHRQELARWDWFRSVSAGVLAGDAQAYDAVIRYLSPFQELSDLGSDVAISPGEPWCVEAKLTVRDPDVVPDEIHSLTSGGKLAIKKMPKARYWEVYQDHVCSCALRVARELFALLPIDIALVNVHGMALNKATGHEELQVLLSVGFSRATVERLNFDAIDPSEAMQSFNHRMEFSKTAGFKRVQPLAQADFRPSSARWQCAS